MVDTGSKKETKKLCELQSQTMWILYLETLSSDPQLGEKH